MSAGGSEAGEGLDRFATEEQKEEQRAEERRAAKRENHFWRMKILIGQPEKSQRSRILFRESACRGHERTAEGWHRTRRWESACRESGAVFDLDIFAFDRGRRIGFDEGKHFLVEGRGTYMAVAIEINLLGRFEHLENALFCQCRTEMMGKSEKGAMRSRMVFSSGR